MSIPAKEMAAVTRKVFAQSIYRLVTAPLPPPFQRAWDKAMAETKDDDHYYLSTGWE